MQRIADEAHSDMDYLRSKMGQSDSSTKLSVQSDSNNQPTTPFTIKMLGLPFSIKEKGIIEFFHPLSAAAVRMTSDPQGKPSGRAYVDFNTKADLQTALKRNNDCIGHRYIELFIDIGPQSDRQAPPTQNNKPWADNDPVEDISDSGRLFIRNLSYSTNEQDLSNLFGEFGPLTEVTIPLDKTSNKSTGIAFITYMLPEHAVKAFEKLDGQIFQGRLLHLLPSKPRESKESHSTAAGSSFKNNKLKKAKSDASKGHNWNTLFLGSNAVVSAIADKYSVDKSDVLDHSTGGSSAVRLALGETQLLTETRSFMESKGVQLDMFSNSSLQRSKTIILAKNLPYGTTESELFNLFQPHVSQIILPPAGVSALIEYSEPIHARSSFQSLAYTSFKHLPLYLEWAPEAVIQTKATEAPPIDTPTVEITDNCTVFVKNLNFSTSESDLEVLMSKVGKIESVTVAKKKNLKDVSKPLSMGYGFVQYSTEKGASKAIKRLQHSELDGHKLELKLSIRQISTSNNSDKSSKSTNQISAKILVRNIPFEASRHELKELFRTFGTLKIIRLPKKLGSSQSDHRGFGFVEYSTKQEAKRAFDSLCQSTHLYGRRLVLEWAESEESVDAIRKRTGEHFHGNDIKKSKGSELLGRLEQAMES